MMKNTLFQVRDAKSDEFKHLGDLMVKVYAQLPGFPSPEEQPRYYDMLANIGDFTRKPKVRLLVAANADGQIAGGVVYFGDMQYYGSGGFRV